MEHSSPDAADSIDLYCLQINTEVRAISFLDTEPVLGKRGAGGVGGLAMREVLSLAGGLCLAKPDSGATAEM